MQKKKSSPSLSIIIGILLFAAGIFLYFNSPPSLMKGDIFIVKEGETTKNAALRLKRQNLITSDKFFLMMSMAAGNMGIRKGKYKIESGESSAGILLKLSRGDILKRKITIPEGFNLYSIAERLSAQQITNYGELFYYASNRQYLNSIGISSMSAEGYLFPDTYVFPEDSDARDILTAMYKRLETVLSSIDPSQLKERNLTIHQLLTLASLIEKEAKIPGERRYISAVFQNRIKKNMKMDCDPTVRYAVKNFTGRITFRDLACNSPYNTYLFKGLPPTPICSAGKDSIMATLYPAEADFLYFVSRNDGSHYFSTSLKEHNKAVNFYQKGIRNGFADRQRL